MTDKIKNFIIENRDLIDRNEFDELYHEAVSIFQSDPDRISELSQIFLNSDIDFLKYMTYIPIACFNRLDITEITIPSTIQSIGNSAFRHCELLEKIKIPNSVTHIHAYAFSGCDNLSNIILPNNIIRIEPMSLYNSGITQIKIPDSVISIDEYAFSCCRKLKRLTIPDTVEDIGNRAFQDCIELTDITIPSSVKKIGSYAFNLCPIVKITTTKGSYAEEYAKKNNIKIKLI